MSLERLPHEQRVADEHQQLVNRLELLGYFIHSERFAPLHPEDQALLLTQQMLMRNLAEILRQRLVRFDHG